MKEFTIDGKAVQQILPPDPSDTDRHPRLIFNGYGVHAGQVFEAWIPGEGFKRISIEMSWDYDDYRCWYVATKGCEGVCPIGLWCIVK
jgi:hypothetical protein